MRDDVNTGSGLFNPFVVTLNQACGLTLLCCLWQLSANASVQTLDVGVTVFDPGLPADASTHGKQGLYPSIRNAEAQYMPVLLREVLVESGEWGAVRVLPEAVESTDLMVSGTIMHSDGRRLQLHIVAVDAAGRAWLDRVYTGQAGPANYPVQAADDPFFEVYRQIADDLTASRREKSTAQLAALRQIALLRYAANLAPVAFSTYLGADADGYFTLDRLPAHDDPMLARVLRLRDQEYLFIDTVDEQYLRLSEQMAPTYNLWRQFGAEQADFREAFEDRVSARERSGAAGSYAALQQTYNAYRLSKMYEQDLDELAGGFNNEVAPTLMEVSGTVYRLSGSLAMQYAEWRGILRRIFELEMGLAPVS
ncbi:MAG: hypothetical protein HRT77_14280 [Halioglobus sp.]|nr:hypothetical protein [Halioglobus sp.]